MNRYDGSASIRMAEVDVATSLPEHLKTSPLQSLDDLRL